MKDNLYAFRMKAIFSDKITWFITVLTLLVSLFLINNLSGNAGERSSVPIGLVNLDRSESADELTGKIKEVPALYVYEKEERELKELLYKEEIRAYFIIKAGYEKSIREGKTEELITMYFTEGDESAKILSDIIAGEMLHKICMYKSYHLYRSLPFKDTDKNDFNSETANNRLSEKEYAAYSNSLAATPDFDFAFDMRMINTSNQNQEREINNSVLYLQAVWGIIAMLLSFTAMLMTAGSVFEKESGIQRRLKVSVIKPYTMDISHFGAAFTVLSILSLFLCGVLIGKTGDLSMNRAIPLFLSLELFSMVMILWFLFLGKLTGRTSRYQLFGVISIFAFGLLGFLYMVEDFTKDKLLNISKIIPNRWFIEGFTDIILNKNLQGIPYISYAGFIISAMGLLILNGFINKRQYE